MRAVVVVILHLRTIAVLMAVLTISKYRLSVLQIILITGLTKLSAVLQNAFMYRAATLTIANLVLTTCGYHRIKHGLKFHSRSPKTMLYLVVLLITFGLQYLHNSYRYHHHMPLYHQNALILLYNALKPLSLSLTGMLPSVYQYLTLGHLATTVGMLALSYTGHNYRDPRWGELLYVLGPSACITFLLEQLEAVFAYNLLLPQMFYFVQALFNFLFATLDLCCDLYWPTIGLPGAGLLLEGVYLAAFVLTELAIMYIASMTYTVRFTGDKESRLMIFDNTFQNTFEAGTLLVGSLILLRAQLWGPIVDIPLVRAQIWRAARLWVICNLQGVLYLLELVYTGI